MDGRQRIADAIAEALSDLIDGRLKDRPKSATEWAEKTREGVADMVVFHKAMDQENVCKCGGRNGLVLTVPKGGEVGGHVVMTFFDHHEGGMAAGVQLTREEAKYLVNLLGEAIAASEAIPVPETSAT